MKRTRLQMLLTGLLFATMSLSAADEAGSPAPSAPQGWCTKAASAALSEFNTHPPTDTNTLLNALISTGKALELADETPEAVRLYEKAIMLAKAHIQMTGTNNETSIRVYIEALIQLGGMKYSKFRYEDAENIYRRAVETTRLTLPEKDPLAKITRNRYALALGQRYPLEQRREFYLTLKESCVKAFGKKEGETALVLDELAKMAMITTNYHQAAVYAEEALKAQRHTLKSNHPLLADSINNLASVYYAMGKTEKVAPLLKEALKIRTAAFGPDHPKTLLSRKNLESLR